MVEVKHTSEAIEKFYAGLSPKELRRQLQNDNAIAAAGSLQKAYGNNPSRFTKGRGEWAGTFWCLKGTIADGPFKTYREAVEHGRNLDADATLSPPTREEGGRDDA